MEQGKLKTQKKNQFNVRFQTVVKNKVIIGQKQNSKLPFCFTFHNSVKNMFITIITPKAKTILENYFGL